jgi:CheY-like chemotaxis protein
VKPAADSARILVSTDNADDARQILRQLEDDFANVRSSTDPNRAVADFEKHKPDVLVFAFDRLEKAQRYYLGLYRLGETFQNHRHRTVVLCNKEEVREAFELCKKEYFDDYVLYWPHAQDGLRLAMSVRIACRQVTPLDSEALQSAELRSHARHLSDLERTLGREFVDGEQHVAAARSSIGQGERDVAGAFDEFSERLMRGASVGSVSVMAQASLAQEIGQLKSQQVAQALRAGTSGIGPIASWASNLKSQIEPALAGTRALAERIRRMRSIVMVVDDDELIRDLVRRALDPEVYEVLLAKDADGASSQLRRARPDVILMDIGLPDTDGVSLTQQFKASPHLAQIPIVMMTGDARKETLVSSIAAGAIGFVVKPFTRESLTAKLEQVLLR